MKKFSNTEVDLKKRVTYKKKSVNIKKLSIKMLKKKIENFRVLNFAVAKNKMEFWWH